MLRHLTVGFVHTGNGTAEVVAKNDTLPHTPTAVLEPPLLTYFYGVIVLQQIDYAGIGGGVLGLLRY